LTIGLDSIACVTTLFVFLFKNRYASFLHKKRPQKVAFSNNFFISSGSSARKDNSFLSIGCQNESSLQWSACLRISAFFPPYRSSPTIG